MGLADLHNHTARCGHASGDAEEYIAAAVKKGISTIGFSDHAPLDEALREGESMEPGETEAYIEEIRTLAKKYAPSAEVLTGFEVDYPLHSAFDKKYFSDKRIDYLTGSCHFLNGWAFDNERFASEFSKRDINEVYASYYRLTEELIESRLFNILGHFDLVKKFGHRASKDFSAVIERLAKKAAACKIAVELNTSGLLKPAKETYPSQKVLKIFFRCNVPVTLGSDAHSPEQAGFGIEEASRTLLRIGYKKLAAFRGRRLFLIPIDSQSP